MLTYGRIGKKFFVENPHYYILFNEEKGATIEKWLVKKAGNINVIQREGIEMYWSEKPKGNPESWPERHFEQEYGGKATIEILTSSEERLIIEIETPCGWTKSPVKYYGSTRTHWYFWDSQPYAYVEFEEDHKGMAPPDSELWFKRYVGTPPHLFTHYAKKLDTWALDNLKIIPDYSKFLRGEIYVRTPIEKQIEGDPPRYPVAKWLTLYNDHVGFALIAPVLKFWRGDSYPQTSRSGVFHSYAMDELIYYCRMMPNQNWKMSLIYYAYPIEAPIEAPYEKIEKEIFPGLDVGNSFLEFARKDLKPRIYFDDTLLTTYTVAFPIMKKLGLTGTIGVITNKIGGKTITGEKEVPCMTLSQLRKLIEHGWEIASHSVTHPQPPKSQSFTELSIEETRYEAEESKKWIEENLGITPKIFIVPQHLVREDQAVEILKYYKEIRPFPVPKNILVFHEILQDELSLEGFLKSLKEIYFEKRFYLEYLGGS